MLAGRFSDALHRHRRVLLGLWLIHAFLLHYYVLGFYSWDGFGYRCVPIVEALAEKLKGDEKAGAEIVARALEEPTKQIAVNAGMEGGVIVEKVKNLKGANGLNAKTGEYEDLVKAGVTDAAKVTRSALQNAASIAALFLTTEAVVADKPSEAPAMPGGMPGGMEGMVDF